MLELPVIRISDEAYAHLETLAVGFETPGKVIERLIEKATGKPIEKASSSYETEITQTMIHEAYAQAHAVYSGDTPVGEAVSALRALGMHPGSARDYVNNFQKMMKGEVFKRTMNSAAIRYYLENILNDEGKAILKKAVSSVRQHVEYYEKFSNGKLRKIHVIIEEFEALLKTLK